MKPTKTIPISDELDFLKEIRISDRVEDMIFPWLEGGFFSNSWTIKTPTPVTRKFDWDRILPNGIYLSSTGSEPSSSSSIILPSIRSSDGQYVIEQDLRPFLNQIKRATGLFPHPRISKRCQFTTHYQFFLLMITLSEWAFLNEDIFKPRTHTFSLIDSSDYEYFLLQLATGGKAQLFNYEQRFSASLEKIISSVRNDSDLFGRINHVLATTPIICSTPSELLPFLLFSQEETAILRAWLLLNGYIGERGGMAGRFFPEIYFKRHLFIEIKADALPAKIQLIFRTFHFVQQPKSLDFTASSIKEYLPSGEMTLIEQHQNKQSHMNCSIIEQHQLQLNKLIKISRFLPNALPPKTTLSAISFKSLYDLNLPPKGRTKTIPVGIAMHALGEAVSFILNYGDAVVDLALAVRKEMGEVESEWSDAGFSDVSNKYFSSKLSSLKNQPSQLEKLNICHIASTYSNYGEERYNSHGGNARTEILRRQMGVLDALNLLIASVIIVIGTTAARRQIEILSLPSDCLEGILGKGWYLRFKLGKNILGAVNGNLSRCIPNVASRAIYLLDRLNRDWRKLCGGEDSNSLFDGYNGNFWTCGHFLSSSVNRVLDTFCDYIEIPLDETGKRWYIRSHQLRRFWAYSFFYKFGIGELSTVGWFLGHADTEQTWMYILESFAGHDNELLKIKSAYASEILYSKTKDEPDNIEAIEKIRRRVLEHFGRKDFDLVNEDDLLAYLENLMEDKEFDIEPQFFTDSNGKNYRIVWLINNKSRNH